ncbi:MAG: hypothetical protein JW747_06905 [Candidatus Aminicenantes bacterium]|nr:hypothetical protein [Candidatus Aminicenantes bacterium]
MNGRKRNFCAGAFVSALMMMNINPAFAFPDAPSQSEEKSTYKEIKRKFNIDMLKWLKGTLTNLPDSITTLTLNKPVSAYNLSKWRSGPYQAGLTLWEGDTSKGDQWQLLVNDKGTIVTIAHTFRNKSSDFIEILLRYGMERYMPFFLEYYQEGGLNYHHFRQIWRDRGSTRSLFFLSGKDFISVQVGSDELTAMPKIEQNMMNALSKIFPDLKIEIYKQKSDGSLIINYIIMNEAADDAYFSRLLVLAVAYTDLAKTMYPDLGDWAKSKVFFLFSNIKALGWLKADDCTAAEGIKDVKAKQQFIIDKFHNTLVYYVQKCGKKP